MTIQYVGGQVASRAGATSTLSVNYALTGGIGTVPQIGDLIIVTSVVGSAARNPAQAITTPGTWTALGQLNPTTASFDTSLNVSYKFMPDWATAETSLTIPSTGNVADAQSYCIQVFRGVDSTTPLDVSVVSANGINTTRADPPSITPTTAGAWIVVCSGGAAGTSSALTYSGLTNVLSSAGSDTNDSVVGCGYKSDWSSGAYDPAASSTGSAVSAADSWAAYTIALRPASAASSFAHDFASALDTTNVWELFTTDANCAVAAASGELKITVNPTSTTSREGDARSKQSFSLEGVRSYVKLKQGHVSGGAGAEIAYSLDNTNGSALYFTQLSDGTITGGYRITNSATQLFSITYVPATHQWLSIRHASGNIYWETAPDADASGATPGSWTQRGTVAESTYTPGVGRLDYRIYSYTYQNVGSVDTRWDGLNTTANSSGGIINAVETGPDTAVITGTVAVAGAVAATESGADVAAIPGVVKIEGSIAATESGSDTAAIPGVVKVAGSAAVTESGSDTAAIAGEVKIAGAIAAVESGSDVAVINGSSAVQGVIAATESGADTAALPGAVLVSTTIALQESGSDVAAIAGVVKVAGSIAAFETTSDAAALVGEVKVVGVAAALESGSDVAAIAGLVGVAGQIVATESGQDVAVLSGAVKVAGSVAAVETGSDVAVIEGTVEQLPGVHGDVVLVESGADTASIAGVVKVSGYADIYETGSDTAIIIMHNSVLDVILGRGGTRPSPLQGRERVRQSSDRPANIQTRTRP